VLSSLATPKAKIAEASPDKFDYFLTNLLKIGSREKGFQQGSRQFLDSVGKKGVIKVHNEHPMQHLLKAFPGWTVSNLSACGRLPLTPGLFDIVIIDEASQCDIPSSFPLLYRAKQAVIIGDPLQLSSITNLSSQTESSLLNKHEIQNPGSFRYSGNSIYDLAAASAPADSQTFLAQHYRCHPDIIEFANSAHWYNSNLEAVTDCNSLRRDTRWKMGISWLEVSGSPVMEETGFWIPEEVDRIAQEVETLLMERNFEGTLGVVTPFRRMANALQQRIENSSIHQKILTACDFRADTAHRFQGDERDIIFYAPCYHPDMPNKHKWFLSSQKNVFNVALSRARSSFIVVGNKEALRGCEIDYLQDFVGFSEELERPKQRNKTPEGVQRGHWEPILEKALLEKGVPILPQYNVGPFWLDFALIENSRKLNIEVDGEQFHKNESGMRCQRDIDRNIYLKSQGWEVMRFWVYQLRDNLDECTQQIQQWLIKRN
jgi:superfamily I DNA and/or RNA helicase